MDIPFILSMSSNSYARTFDSTYRRSPLFFPAPPQNHLLVSDGAGNVTGTPNILTELDTQVNANTAGLATLAFGFAQFNARQKVIEFDRANTDTGDSFVDFEIPHGLTTAEFNNIQGISGVLSYTLLSDGVTKVFKPIGGPGTLVSIANFISASFRQDAIDETNINLSVVDQDTIVVKYRVEIRIKDPAV